MCRTYFKLYPNEKHFKKKVFRLKRKRMVITTNGSTIHWMSNSGIMIKDPTSCSTINYVI